MECVASSNQPIVYKLNRTAFEEKNIIIIRVFFNWKTITCLQYNYENIREADLQ